MMRSMVYLMTNIAEYPAIYPPKIPPINPALIAIADSPAINPGAIPGFPAMENAIPTAMISGNNPSAAPPIVASASQNVNLPCTSPAAYILVPPSAIPIATKKPPPHTIGII